MLVQINCKGGKANYGKCDNYCGYNSFTNIIFT